MNLMNKLTTYASLIGVIGAIGGGFYAWGEFNTRLDAIESKPALNIAPLDDKISTINDKVSGIEVDLIDRIDALREKVEEGNEVDLSVLEDLIHEVEAAILTDLNAMKETLTEMDKKVRIVEKENELQDERIEANRLKSTNPLAG
jgi:hypothetical protein